LPGEFGKERGPSFLEGLDPGPELSHLAVDALELGLRLLFPEVSLALLGSDQLLDLAAEQPRPRVPVRLGVPVLELASATRASSTVPDRPSSRSAHPAVTRSLPRRRHSASTLSRGVMPASLLLVRCLDQRVLRQGQVGPATSRTLAMNSLSLHAKSARPRFSSVMRSMSKASSSPPCPAVASRRTCTTRELAQVVVVAVAHGAA
jgi:hypothetical protein